VTNPLYDLIRVHSDQKQPYLHIVGFKFKDVVSAEEQANLMQECASLHETCGGIDAGILKLVTRPNIDSRKGFTWIELAIFANPEAFIHFHAHPAHTAFAQKISQQADVWYCFDVSSDWIVTQGEASLPNQLEVDPIWSEERICRFLQDLIAVRNEKRFWPDEATFQAVHSLSLIHI
jgi:hypothetical protein